MLRSTWKVSADEGHTSYVFVGRRACAHLVLAYRFLVRRPWARIGEMQPDIVPGAVFPDYDFLTTAASTVRSRSCSKANRWCWCVRFVRGRGSLRRLSTQPRLG